MEHDRESTEQNDRESTEEGAPRSAPGVAGARNAGERTVAEQHEGDFAAGEHDGPYGGPGGDAREKQEEGDRELGTEGK